MPFYKATATPRPSDSDELSFREINYSDGIEDFTPHVIATTTLDTISTVTGTLINVWFLTAILKSPEIRSSRRNKIICGMLAVNLIESAICLPIVAIYGALSLLDIRGIFNCDFFIFLSSLYHMQDFIGNWYIFILVCVYTAQVMNFEPKFTPLWMKIITAVVITSPCVFALLVLSITMNSYLRASEVFCFVIDFKGLQLYASLDMIVPLALASLLLVVTAVLKYRRNPYVHLCDNIHAQLIDDRSHIDPLRPFVALLVTSVVADLCMAFALINLKHLLRTGLEIWLTVVYAFEVVGFLRLILVPVLLLLFPDIRERIKTWRPCSRPAPQADLVVVYERNAS